MIPALRRSGCRTLASTLALALALRLAMTLALALTTRPVMALVMRPSCHLQTVACYDEITVGS